MHTDSPNTGCARRWLRNSCFDRVWLLFFARSEQNSSLGAPLQPIPLSRLRLCGLDHRQRQRRCATTHLQFRRTMADSENDRRSELERLRLASDLRQLAKETSDPDLREHWLRMARQWSGEVHEPKDDTGVDTAVDKDLDE